MSSIHGHEVLQMMIASGESYSVASLEAAQLVTFLQQKGKFIAVEEGFNTSESKICRH
ncbi:YecH family protein [Klebsiella aerogenes]|nr:YecH family protein [Klebsiella aerogenes]